MVDIQSASAPLQSAALQAAAQSASALTPVQAAVTNIPQSLASLERSIQINATVVGLSASNEMTLLTALGNITVTVALQTASADKQNLLQQLMAIVDGQKTLTLSLQPGSPPTQAVLLLPASSAAPTSPNTTATASPGLPPPPLAQGEVLSAIILPSTPPAPPAINTAIPNTPNLAQEIVFATPNIAEPVFSLPATALPQNIAPQNILPTTAQASPPIPLIEIATENSATENTQALLPNVSFIPTQNLTSAAQTPAFTQSQLPSAISLTSPQVSSALLASPATTFAATQQLSVQQSTTQTAPSLATLLQPGNAVTLRVEAMVLPAPAAAAMSAMPTIASLPAPNANQVMATVVGTGTSGQLLLKAGDVTFFVKTPVAAPIGTEVLVTVEIPKPDVPFILPSSTPTNFAVLPQAIAAMAQIDPQALAHMMTTRMPQPTDYLPGSLLFLLNAFKQGSANEWLGDNIAETLIRAGRADLINSLSQELGNAGQMAQDAVVGEWQSYPIPLYSGQQFHALTLYVHSDRDARKDQTVAPANNAGKIRFLIDMRLSKLGAMQIDGFVQSKKLDMILRSEAILPDGLHNELRGAYIKALGAVGYAGSLNFQTGRQHWMKMQKPALNGITT